jgi:hypothetical protein
MGLERYCLFYKKTGVFIQLDGYSVVGELGRWMVK